MTDSSTTAEDYGRFYKVCREGRLHRKSPGGPYVELRCRHVLKRLQFLPVKSIKRIE
jgi:hypothetical protein